jgi:hypothetical protein
MAKNKNTFEKRRKEMERMRKAEDKRQRRFARRGNRGQTDAPGAPSPEPATEQDTDQIDLFPDIPMGQSPIAQLPRVDGVTDSTGTDTGPGLRREEVS